MITIEEIIRQTEGLGIQMLPIELFEIAKAIKPPMNVLVFGLGNDSLFWHNLNTGGRTVFIEDKKKWFDEVKGKVKGKNPGLEAYKVKYGTVRTEWQDLIDKPDKLELDIPSQLKGIEWDVIIVDGPAGHTDEAPGRMKSIYLASKIIKNGGDIFVHDAHRDVEREYCKKYLLDRNLVSTVKGRSVLNHYRFIRA